MLSYDLRLMSTYPCIEDSLFVHMTVACSRHATLLRVGDTEGRLSFPTRTRTPFGIAAATQKGRCPDHVLCGARLNLSSRVDAMGLDLRHLARLVLHRPWSDPPDDDPF